ncbi:MAG: hypothetical protein FRX49_11963 [Trebouxia sp. A1-2]|nr:MAG: hypothetical protein FRX49_11963 [Trebouxia sp. A1-2]
MSTHFFFIKHTLYVGLIVVLKPFPVRKRPDSGHFAPGEKIIEAHLTRETSIPSINAQGSLATRYWNL